jgi:hypothetical protein
VYQISSKSDDKWLSYARQGFFNMAAAAILENGVRPTVLSFMDSAYRS